MAQVGCDNAQAKPAPSSLYPHVHRCGRCAAPHGERARVLFFTVSSQHCGCGPHCRGGNVRRSLRTLTVAWETGLSKWKGERQDLTVRSPDRKIPVRTVGASLPPSHREQIGPRRPVFFAVPCRCAGLDHAAVQCLRRQAAARSTPHCRQRQRVPRSASTRLSGVSAWPLPQRVGAKTLSDGRF